MSEHESVVYYIGGIYAGIVKIGITQRLKGRLADLRRIHGGSLRVLAWEPGYRDLETHRHLQFMAARFDGEWFWQTPALMRHIAALEHDVTRFGIRTPRREELVRS